MKINYKDIKIAPIKRKQKMLKRVLCFDKDGNFVEVYDSVYIAAKKLGLHYVNIRNVLSKKCTAKTSGGFQWRYEKDILEAIKKNGIKKWMEVIDE